MTYASLRPALGVALASLFVVLTGCSGAHGENDHSESAAHQEATLHVSRPMIRDIDAAREYVAVVRSSRHIAVSALVEGYLESVAVNEGQRVEEGQLLFKVFPAAYEAEFRKAAAEAEAAELEYKNTKSLGDRKVVAPTEVALSEARFRTAKAEAELAETHLGFTEIKAPFAGMVDRLEAREGSLVEEGEQLTTLSDNSAMWVYFNVPEAEYLDYVTSTRTDGENAVRLRLANGTLFGSSGTVTTIEADFDPQTGTIAFRADFPNPDALLRNGQTGNIVMTRRINDALIIPQKATFEVLDQTYVFVIDEQGVAHQRNVKIAEELEDIFIIESGLLPDEQIVVEGVRFVRDGEHAEFEFVEPHVVFAQLKTEAE